MPRRGRIGESEYTQDKQAVYDGILRMAGGIWRGHQRNCVSRGEGISPTVAIFDLTAGDGTCAVTNKGKGSPLIACDALAEIGLPYEAFFFEQDKEHAARLKLLLNGNRHARVIEGDCNETAAATARYYLNRQSAPVLGFIYADPTGKDVPTAAIASLLSSPNARKLDVLINVAATSLKRAGDQRIDDVVRLIPKKHWMVREPKTCWQWTFLLGSNWENFPRWKKQGFVRLKSREGEAWMRRMSLTEHEDQTMRQASLPFSLTATIANISAIHGFSK